MTIRFLCRPEQLMPVLVAVPLLLGCGAKEEIRSYTVEKEKQPAVPIATSAPPADASAVASRMLGAIVPVGEQTWFFKVTGPSAAVDKNADTINEFFQSIQVASGAEKPVWTTPQGWEEEGPRDMRAATLKIPADDQPLELSVIPLPSSGLLENVNRWRGQLQLPPIDEASLASSVKESKAGEAKMWLVDLTGKASAGGMMPPFAGGGPFSGGQRPPVNGPFAGGAAPRAPSAAPDSKGPADLPPGHPPVASDGGPVDAPADAPFKYVAPESWQSQPASGFRKAAFKINDGDKKAEVTVIDLAGSAPSIADPLQNVNRWRTEIGLPPIETDQLKGLVQEVTVDGKPSTYVELIPDAANPAESKASEATFAATVPAGGLIWFIKLRGDRDLVVAQRDNFKSFLESIRFNSDGGAGDGN